MGRIIVEQITSVDGYAAAPDGNIDFMRAAGDLSEAEPELLEIVAGADAMLFGATTYRMFAAYWPEADAEIERVTTFINEKPKHVFSSTLDEAPWGGLEPAILERGDVVERSEELKRQYPGDLIVWGSLKLTDALFVAGLVDVLRIRTVPILLGEGLAIAPPAASGTMQRLDRVNTYPSGHTVVQYSLAT
jgi:dihydrofolate reductase